jgi:hypothetical protein
MNRDTCIACPCARTCGLLCETCARGLVGDDICPEQFTARGTQLVPGAANAWLVDGFGTPHCLSVAKDAPVQLRSLSMGRGRSSDVCVAERTISTAHAVLEYRPLSNAWFVVDCGSDNGVFVNDDRVPRRFPLEAFDRVFLGRRIGFVFVPIDDVDVAAATTELLWWRAQSWTDDTMGDVGAVDATPLRVAAVTEGGAVASWGAERVTLSELEYELVATLQRRFVDDEGLDAHARGFVPAALLLETLAFRSEAPTHANLRGLVRKLRRKLADNEHATDVIESRQGLGYRLARPLILS